MELSQDAFLIGLGYNKTEALLAQQDRIKKNTRNFDTIKKAILTLHEHLKVHNSFVSFSSSNDYVKIKNQATNIELVKEINIIINKWANKHKIEIEKVFGKETFYILGTKK